MHIHTHSLTGTQITLTFNHTQALTHVYNVFNKLIYNYKNYTAGPFAGDRSHCNEHMNLSPS